ncbi:MAG: aminoacyl-tRNA hydrolase [Chloroflexota bacterium]
MPETTLIVGLGNPGAKYADTRHNVGFRVVEKLAQKHGLSFDKTEHHAQTASGTILGKRVLLAKPMTFMNESGNAVQPLVSFYKIEPDHILIIGDDIDIPLGTLRLRKSGSSGGQNGLKHILQRLGTQEIARARFGVGRPPGHKNAADHVLAPFKGDDEILAAEVRDRAVEAIETWLRDGIEMAMTRYNGTGEKPAPKPQPVKNPPE